jgi:NitT/TauT family transport system permease protein
MRSLPAWHRSILFPLVTVAGLLLVWSDLVQRLDVSPHLLPAPEVVLLRLWDGLSSGEMWPHLGATAAAALAGYALGCGSAILVAAILAEWPLAERALYPLILTLQAMPKVSIAPLILIWVGFGIESQVILVALICFFPIFIVAFVGLRAVDANLLDLYRALSAGRLHVLFHVKIPAAADSIFTGLEVAVLFALIGCVVMEFITGRQGTGFLIENSANTLDTPLAIATVVALGILGVIGTQIVRFAHRRVVFWGGPAQTAQAAQLSGL